MCTSAFKRNSSTEGADRARQTSNDTALLIERQNRKFVGNHLLPTAMVSTSMHTVRIATFVLFLTALFTLGTASAQAQGKSEKKKTATTKAATMVYVHLVDNTPKNYGNWYNPFFTPLKARFGDGLKVHPSVAEAMKVAKNGDAVVILSGAFDAKEKRYLFSLVINVQEKLANGDNTLSYLTGTAGISTEATAQSDAVSGATIIVNACDQLVKSGRMKTR